MSADHYRSPWLTIWLHPRQTVSRLLETKPEKGFLTLCVLFGLPQYFQFAYQSSLSDSWPFEQVLLGALLSSPLIGWLLISFAGRLLALTGRWLGGQGSSLQVRHAVAWATLPIGSLSAMWAILIMKFGPALFSRLPPMVPSQDTTFYSAGSSFAIVLMILWSLILLFNTLSIVQQHSRTKAIAAIILAAVAVFVPLFIAALAISLVAMPSPRQG